MTRTWVSISRGRVMRTVVAVFTAATLTSCLAGEKHETSGVPPATGDSQQAIRLLNARCTVCHSTDLITQQRLNESKWRAEVNKMVSWGAQLSLPEQDTLVAYLASRYHPAAPDATREDEVTERGQPPAATSEAGVVLTGHPRRGAAVYAQNCLPCHGEAASGGMGPKLAGNAILSNDASFRQTVMQGRGAMPAWGPILKPQEIEDVHTWLKSLR